MRLVWRETSKIKERARVVAWSCHCRSAVYELCRAGGQSYIRRTDYDEKGETVYETYRWSFIKASEVWAALLEGRTV